MTNDRTLRGSGTLVVTGTLRKSSHGPTALSVVPPDGSPIAVLGTIEVQAGLLDVAGPGLVVEGTLSVNATSAQTGVVRSTTMSLAPGGHLRVGVAGPAPTARSGMVIVTGAPPDLAGSLDLVPDATFRVVGAQRLTLVSATGEPTGQPTVIGGDDLGGADATVVTEPGGVFLEVAPSPD